MNIGAGRVVFQDLVKINIAVEKGTLGEEKTLVEAFDYAKKNQRAIHFIGLVSDGGVHSHLDHLKGLIKAAQKHNCSRVFVHAFTDGRDCDPKSGLIFIKDLLTYLKKYVGSIASVVGRYYAMDRDKRWERVKVAYEALVKGTGIKTTNIASAIEAAYGKNITDEFMPPIIATDTSGKPIAKINQGDVVICFNFRTDRGREITEVLTQRDFPNEGMYKMSLHYLTMTSYDDSYKNIKVVFKKDNLSNTLGEVLEKENKNQIRIAETEKYPHVTFFFSGGKENTFKGEKEYYVPLPKWLLMIYNPR